MRHLKILGENGFIQLNFLIVGHSHNIIDQKHSIIQCKWSKSTLYSLEDWISMINAIPNFMAEALLPFDFNLWLSPHLNALAKDLRLSSSCF